MREPFVANLKCPSETSFCWFGTTIEKLHGWALTYVILVTEQIEALHSWFFYKFERLQL